jgi:sulfite exporter TauE/SafE
LVASRRLVWYAPLVRFIASLKSQMSTLLQRSSLVSLASLGLLNGLLPCGLVYVACAGAAASGHVLGGMGYMLAFGLGTLPMMLTVSLSRRMVPASWRVGLRAAVPISVFVVAMLLILRGLSLGIPGLSPDMAQPGACCAP